MSLNIAFIYPWATHGGVERVLINRVKAFSSLNYKIDILFTHDSGAYYSIENAIAFNENAKVKIINFQHLNEQNYDLIFCIDFPEALEYCHNNNLRYFAECHTGYKENRAYLQKLPKSCMGVVFPSSCFMQEIEDELMQINQEKFLLRNCVPWDIHPDISSRTIQLPYWSKKPLLFFGRMDKLKNITELFDAFKILEEKAPEEYILVLCGPQSKEINIHNELQARNIYEAIILPPIPFNNTQCFLDAFSKTKGVFISPSSAESFGLSAAEAISTGIPVLLSNINAHMHLVKGYEYDFTYTLYDANDLANKIIAMNENFENAKVSVLKVRDALSSSVFIEDWRVLEKFL